MERHLAFFAATILVMGLGGCSAGDGVTTLDEVQTAGPDNGEVDAALKTLSTSTPLPQGMSVDSFIAMSPDPTMWADLGANYANLSNPVFSVIAGDMIDGGCAFSTLLSVSPGDADKEDVSLKLNLSTCQVIVATGTPMDSDPDVIEQSTGQTESKSGTPLYSVSSDTLSYTASMKTYWTDPVDITVNSVVDVIQWYTDGQSVSNGKCTQNTNYFAPSGWGIQAHNLDCHYNSLNGSSVGVTASSYTHYHNGVFCRAVAIAIGGIIGTLLPSGATDVYYNRNIVWGWANGNHYCLSNSIVTGHCTSFLSEHKRCSGQASIASVGNQCISGCCDGTTDSAQQASDSTECFSLLATSCQNRGLAWMDYNGQRIFSQACM